MGNWQVDSRSAKEFQICNREGSNQCLILSEDLMGFMFKSNRGTRQVFQV